MTINIQEELHKKGYIAKWSIVGVGIDIFSESSGEKVLYFNPLEDQTAQQRLDFIKDKLGI